MSTPDRTTVQRLVALEHANDVRHRRAIAKRDLRAGRVNVVDYITAPPEWMETMKIVDLLLAAPKIGRVKANQLLWRCRISPSKTVGGISDRQRGEIIQALPVNHCIRRAA
jgi:hypothetical protein